MDQYEKLAQELISMMDKKYKGPPRDDLGAVVRGEMAVLRLLYIKKKSMTAGEITRMLSMTTSRIAAVLNSLQKKDMIIREADPADKRRVLVSITEKGSVFCKERRRQAVEDIKSMLAHLGEEDAAHFVRILTKIHSIDCGQKHQPCDHQACSKEEKDE